MPHHEWGDGFDFTTLNKAQDYIWRFYSKLTKRNPMMKEKYGTIRYEMMPIWITTVKEANLFFEVLKRATEKFPSVTAEIVDDIACDCSHPYYEGYFHAVLYVKAQSKWVSEPKLCPWNKYYTLLTYSEYSKFLDVLEHPSLPSGELLSPLSNKEIPHG